MMVRTLSDLQDDGDRLELPDGRTLTLCIIPDDCRSGFEHINDCDGLGRVAWVDDQRNARHQRDYGTPAPRPQGFTGAARKLSTDYGDQFWWEPYREGHRVYDSPEERQNVRRVMSDGSSLVGLKLSEEVTDSRGNDHVVVIDTAWIGGVDQFYPELVDDLCAELGVTLP